MIRRFKAFQLAGWAIAAACGLLLPSAVAQEFRGTFSGIVTDAQGGSVPKVKVSYGILS